MPFDPAPDHRVVDENRAGYWLQVGSAATGYRAFVPKALPPALTPATLADAELTGRADRALGRLDGMAAIFPEIDIFLSIWLLQEAVYSSQIEGTQSSLSDLLIFEVEGTTAEAIDDVRETANYVTAVEKGIEDLATLPLSVRVLSNAHARLLASGRGSTKQPGTIRTTQNWIGGTRPGTARFVPPPPEYLADILSDLERFLNDVPERTPLLMKAAIAHAQFETIHPFLDGNGRVGRLLIVLLLHAERALSRPLLFLSWFFKQHRDEYYRLLQRVRTDGDWEGWIRFFLEAVETTAEEAVSSARRAMELFSADERRARAKAGRAAASTSSVLHVLQRSPILDVKTIEEQTGLSTPTIHTTLRTLEELGLVREFTGKRRNKMFGYDAYLELLHARDLA